MLSVKPCIRGAQIFLEKAKEKQATLALWAPHAYKYGFLAAWV